MGVVTVDFDGTLYRGDSFKMMFKVAKREYGIREWIHVGVGLIKATVIGFFKGKDAFKHQFFRAFAKSFTGKTTEQLNTFFEALLEEGQDDIHTQLVERVKRHQEDGDRVVILSGALMPFLKAFVRNQDLEPVQIIGTHLLYDKKGKCKGKIGTIVNGDEKVNQIRGWLKENGKYENEVDLWAYADSLSDLPLLHIVKNPVVVNPDERMREVAKEHDWPVFE